MDIRAYRPEELDRVMAIWRAATAIGHPFQSEADLDRDEALIRNQYIDVTESWCARVDGELAGFVSLLGTRVVALFVDPARHRRGIGAALIAFANELHGPLSVEVFESNTVALPFYQRHGFRYLRDEPSPRYPDHTLWLMAQPGAEEL